MSFWGFVIVNFTVLSSTCVTCWSSCRLRGLMRGNCRGCVRAATVISTSPAQEKPATWIVRPFVNCSVKTDLAACPGCRAETV